MNRREMHKYVRAMTNEQLIERNEELYHIIIKLSVDVVEEKDDDERKEQLEHDLMESRVEYGMIYECAYLERKISLLRWEITEKSIQGYLDSRGGCNATIDY